jgi:hypothetical protein
VKSVQPTARVSRAMHRRAEAAIRLVKAGVLDGDLALSMVIWPPAAVEKAQAERRVA